MGLLAIFSYLIVLYIRPQDWMLSMYGFPLADVVLSLAFLISLISLMHERRRICSPLLVFLILYLVVVFLSNFFNGYMNAAVYEFINYSKRVVPFFICIFILRTTKQLKYVLFFVIILSVLVAIQTMFLSKYGISVYGQTITIDNRVAWIGAWDGPNVLCFLFVIAFPFALEFIFGRYNILFRLTNLFFAIILSCGVYLTNSRGGFIAFLSVIFFYVWLKLKNKKNAILIALVPILLFIVFFAPSRMANIRGETSAHQRTWIWEQGLNLFREKPILGIGKGQFEAQHHEIAHNNFVQNITDMGFVGAFIYVSLIYLSFKAVYLVQRLKPKNLKERDIILPLLARALLISMIGFNVVTLFVTMELDILFIWMALCAATLNIARQKVENISFKFSLKDSLAVSSIVVFLAVGIYVVAIKDLV